MQYPSRPLPVVNDSPVPSLERIPTNGQSDNPFNIKALPWNNPKNWPGYNLDYQYCVITDPRINPVVIPNATTLQVDYQVDTEGATLLNLHAPLNNGVDLRIIDTHGNELVVGDNTTLLRQVSSFLGEYWLMPKLFNIYYRRGDTITLEFTNNTGIDFTYYGAFSALKAHYDNPLLDEKLRRQIYGRSIGWNFELPFTQQPGQRTIYNTKIDRPTIITYGNCNASINFLSQMQARIYASKDKNRIGITGAQPVLASYFGFPATVPIGTFMTWPGCYYVEAGDTLNIEITNLNAVAARGGRFVFRGLQW